MSGESGHSRDYDPGAPRGPAVDDDDISLAVGFGPPQGEGEVDNLELAQLPCNDIGNAERLRRRHGRDLIFVRTVGWLAWDGKRWSVENGEAAARAWAHATARSIWAESNALKAAGATKKRLDRFRSHAIRSGNSGSIGGMLREVEPYLSVSTDDLDAVPMLLNVNNGTIDLRTGELRSHRREDRITRLAPVDFELGADCPVFLGFLDEIQPDRERQEFMQRFFGYCATADISEQVVLCLWGRGSNGKSTLMSVVGHILGDYHMVLPVQSILHSNVGRGSEPSPELARLPGARLVTTAEPDAGARLSESTIKTVTGGEKLAVRHLRRDMFEFRPQFKTVISFNNFPRVRGQDEGTWRRLLVLPFEAVFNRDARDPHLVETLKEEARGILGLAGPWGAGVAQARPRHPRRGAPCD